MTRIVIFGAGAQGAVVADILQAAGTPAIAFVDDHGGGTTRFGLPVFGLLKEIEHDAVIVAIGDNAVRRCMMERLAGERFATAIHPFTSIAPSATVGEGSMISAGAIVCPHASIGRGVLLNTKTSVDHDSFIGDFVHIAPGATIGGGVRIGAETLIGAGATVLTNRSVGMRTVIGAGAVVVHNIGNDVAAVGLPARVTSDRRSEEPTR